MLGTPRVSGRKLPAATSWLTGGGELAARIREFDWSNTAIGPMENWSPILTDLATATGELASVFRSATEKAGLKLAVDAPPA